MANTNDLDFLDFDTVSNLEEATSTNGAVDPIRWKPSVSPKNPSYSAIVRLLPQGIEGAKNRTYPSVKVLFHHLNYNGVRMEVKCARNTPGQDCPICRAVWERYNDLLKTYEKGDSHLKVWTNMTARAEWFTNILVREDDNKPGNNNKVLVWRHSDAMERTLRAPFDDSVDNEAKNANAAPAKGARAKLQKEKRHFLPHSPTKGVDFGVIVTWDAVKKMTSYDGSEYVQETTPLADTKDEMLEILNSCHDLKKYLADVPTEEMAAEKWREFIETSAKYSAQGGDTQAAASFSAAPNPNYSSPKTTKVDANEFLGESAEQAAPTEPEQDSDDELMSFADKKVASTKATAKPVAKTMANDLPAGEDGDDDDLPF